MRARLPDGWRLRKRRQERFTAMSHRASYPTRPQAKTLAELIGPALHPVLRKRGLARTELFAWWPEIVGEAFAGWLMRSGSPAASHIEGTKRARRMQ
jgi:hypothetical protein